MKIRLAIAPALVAYINATIMWYHIAISVWGYCFIYEKGTPRPEYKIKQDTNLRTFFY